MCYMHINVRHLSFKKPLSSLLCSYFPPPFHLLSLPTVYLNPPGVRCCTAKSTPPTPMTPAAVRAAASAVRQHLGLKPFPVWLPWRPSCLLLLISLLPRHQLASWHPLSAQSPSSPAPVWARLQHVAADPPPAGGWGDAEHGHKESTRPPNDSPATLHTRCHTLHSLTYTDHDIPMKTQLASLNWCS